MKETYSPDKQLMAVTVILRAKNYDPENGNWYCTKFMPDGRIANAPPEMKRMQNRQKSEDMYPVPRRSRRGRFHLLQRLGKTTPWRHQKNLSQEFARDTNAMMRYSIESLESGALGFTHIAHQEIQSAPMRDSQSTRPVRDVRFLSVNVVG